jgi:hypothetical protein
MGRRWPLDAPDRPLRTETPAGRRAPRFRPGIAAGAVVVRHSLSCNPTRCGKREHVIRSMVSAPGDTMVCAHIVIPRSHPGPRAVVGEGARCEYTARGHDEALRHAR